MQAPPTPSAGVADQSRRAAVAAFIGTTIEWYDFFIYGVAAALVFGPLFFAGETPFLGTLSAFGAFAVGFLARPAGGLIFGHLGDRFGRKRALIATLVMMGLATSGIGLLPTCASAGVWAPVALVLLRLFQGIAVGGEWGGAVLLAAEHAPRGRSTYFASFAQLGSPAGQILSLLAFRLVGLMDKEAFLAWGWRLPFLASVVLLAIGFVIRLGVAESPAFQASQAAEREALDQAAPIPEVLRTQRGPLLMAIAANTFAIASVYLYQVFLITFAVQYLHIDRSVILDALLITAVVQFVVQPVAARVAERLGDESRFLQLSLLWCILTPYPLFLLLETRSFAAITLGLCLIQLGIASFYAVVAGYVAGAFPTRVRYTAISIGYQFSGAVAGGLTPIVGTVLAETSGGAWLPIALFGTALAGISLLGITLLRPHVRALRRWGEGETTT